MAHQIIAVSQKGDRINDHHLTIQKNAPPGSWPAIPERSRSSINQYLKKRFPFNSKNDMIICFSHGIRSCGFFIY